MKLEHIIQAPVGLVFPYFSNLKKFGEVHPVIYQVDSISETNYLFHEKISLLGIPIKFNYRVSLDSTLVNQQVVISSPVQPGVHLSLIFDFKETNQTTKITETVNIQAFSLIKAIFLPFLKKSHYQMVAKIKKELENKQNGLSL